MVDGTLLTPLLLRADPWQIESHCHPAEAALTHPFAIQMLAGLLLLMSTDMFLDGAVVHVVLNAHGEMVDDQVLEESVVRDVEVAVAVQRE
jgi:hypothetical protein